MKAITYPTEPHVTITGVNPLPWAVAVYFD